MQTNSNFEKARKKQDKLPYSALVNKSRNKNWKRVDKRLKEAEYVL